MDAIFHIFGEIVSGEERVKILALLARLSINNILICKNRNIYIYISLGKILFERILH